MESETQKFLGSIVIAAIIAWLLTMIEVWHLVIIAGIVAGLFNATMKKGIIGGALGVCILWTLFIVYEIITVGAYFVMDQFGGLLIDAGFGWLIMILIILLGTLFGALGGGIGSGVMLLIKGSDVSESPAEST